MKKITTYIEGGGVTLDLQDSLVLTHESELFVKTAAVFWNYKNIRKGYNDYISVDGNKVTIDEGYWTFKQLRKEMEENGLTFKEYPYGRIRIDFAKGTSSAGLQNLTSILGYRSSNGPTYTPHISDRPVDIHEGLRYLTVSCNLVNCEHNIGPYGNRSTISSPHFRLMEQDPCLEPQPNTTTLRVKYGWMLVSTVKFSLKLDLIPELFPEMSR